MGSKRWVTGLGYVPHNRLSGRGSKAGSPAMARCAVLTVPSSFKGGIRRLLSELRTGVAARGTGDGGIAAQGVRATACSRAEVLLLVHSSASPSLARKKEGKFESWNKAFCNAASPGAASVAKLRLR